MKITNIMLTLILALIVTIPLISVQPINGASTTTPNPLITPTPLPTASPTPQPTVSPTEQPLIMTLTVNASTCAVGSDRIRFSFNFNYIPGGDLVTIKIALNYKVPTEPTFNLLLLNVTGGSWHFGHSPTIDLGFNVAGTWTFYANATFWSADYLPTPVYATSDTVLIEITPSPTPLPTSTLSPTPLPTSDYPSISPDTTALTASPSASIPINSATSTPSPTSTLVPIPSSETIRPLITPEITLQESNIPDFRLVCIGIAALFAIVTGVLLYIKRRKK